MASPYTDVTFSNSKLIPNLANKLNMLRDDLSAAIGSGGGTPGPIGPVGPSGPAGSTGPPGVRGSIWNTSTSDPGSFTGQQVSDQWLNTTTGDVWQYQ
jgi:hypothetical protein